MHSPVAVWRQKGKKGCIYEGEATSVIYAERNCSLTKCGKKKITRGFSVYVFIYGAFFQTIKFRNSKIFSLARINTQALPRLRWARLHSPTVEIFEKRKNCSF